MARGSAHALDPLPATQGLRRRGGARRGERRLLTGGACALGALIVPRSCRTARLPSRRPFGASVGEESCGGCGARGRSRGLIFLPVRLVSTLTLCPPSRLRHPPAPHTQDENALPGTTQQRLDGFGHGPAVAYPQHHLQPLRLGESLQAAAPCFCHYGSALPQRVPPNATAHAPRLFPGLGTQAAAYPSSRPRHTPSSYRRAPTTARRWVFCPHHPEHPAPHCARSDISRSMLPRA